VVRGIVWDKVWMMMCFFVMICVMRMYVGVIEFDVCFDCNWVGVIVRGIYCGVYYYVILSVCVGFVVCDVWVFVVVVGCM